MFKAFLERRRRRHIIERYFPPELAREMADGGSPLSGIATTERDVEVVLISIRAADADKYSARVKEVGELAMQHGGGCALAASCGDRCFWQCVQNAVRLTGSFCRCRAVAYS